MISVWGVDHGETVSKRWDKGQKQTAFHGSIPVIGLVGGPLDAGNQARRGKKAKVGLKALGRGVAEGTAGGAVGASIGQYGFMPGAIIGGAVGATAGLSHGMGASVGNSRDLGYLRRGHVRHR